MRVDWLSSTGLVFYLAVRPGFFLMIKNTKDFDDCTSAGEYFEIVSLHCSADEIELIIKDNGQGFDPGDRLPGSLGIGLMRERANSIGAVIAIMSAPGQGTQVKLKWPKTQGRK